MQTEERGNADGVTMMMMTPESSTELTDTDERPTPNRSASAVRIAKFNKILDVDMVLPPPPPSANSIRSVR